MKIVVDRRIPLAREAFATLGDVHLADGHALGSAEVRDADVLVVRTVTRVDDALLAGSRVRLVAAASSGVDHVDARCLAARGIILVNAAGCNARPVAEYVLSALCVALGQGDLPLADARVAIIGFGHTGSALYSMLRALGTDCVLNDPPLAEAGGRSDLRPIGDAVQADAISLHVPLTAAGPHRTLGMVNGAFLAGMKPGALLVNTSRGEVVDEAALRLHLAAGRGAAVLDVWSREPAVNAALLTQALIATPHIAGHSQNAKWRATEMVYRRACVALGVQPAWSSPAENAVMPLRTIRIDGTLPDGDAIQMAVLSSYDVRTDSVALRRLPQLPAGAQAACFNEVRDSYLPRAEFCDAGILLDPLRPELAARLSALGFHVAERNPAAGESA